MLLPTLAQEERKVMRRRKVLPSTIDAVDAADADPERHGDDSRHRVKKQMKVPVARESKLKSGALPFNLQSFRL